MTITIKSMRTGNPTEPWDIRVDRASVLGNRPMYKEADRDKVCDEYDAEFNNKIALPAAHPVFMEALNDLVECYKVHGKVNLWCWCVPKRCHAITIKAWLEDIIAYDSSTAYVWPNGDWCWPDELEEYGSNKSDDYESVAVPAWVTEVGDDNVDSYCHNYINR